MISYLSIITICIINIQCASSTPAKFYYRTNDHKKPVYAAQNLTTNLSSLDYSLETIVLIHGWWADATTDFYSYISDSYFNLMECIVIMVDWSASSKLEYYRSALSVEIVGNYVGEFLSNLSQAFDMNIEKLHIIGHSLGAHVGSNAARQITRLTNKTIHRLTGLDPAGPMFELLPNILHLIVGIKSTDATQVDILHTSLILGSVEPSGNADFYANPEFLPLQPGCDAVEMCSHTRSHIYFNESILSCGFRAQALNNTQIVVYGEHMPANISGSYIFHTNSHYPYSQQDSTCD